MFIVLAVSVAMNWKRAEPALRQADWRMLMVGVLFTFLSYVSAGGTYAVVSRAFGMKVPGIRLLIVGFVNMSFNNLLNLGGAAGYSVSAVLLRHENIEQRVILAASLFHFYLYFLVGSSLVPVSMAYLALSHRMSGHAQFGLIVLAAATFVFAMLVNLVVFHRGARETLLRIVERVALKVLHQNIALPLERFVATLYQGMDALRVRRGRIVAVAGLALGDWVFCLVALWFCFHAIGGAPHPAILVSGFFVAIAAGGASMIPGGLGVQDGSMAGIYTLLGSRLQNAALGSILFRVMYYFLPLAVGLVIYTAALVERRSRADSFPLP
jgi:uncharacterized protein (TIRG00374 family)